MSPEERQQEERVLNSIVSHLGGKMLEKEESSGVGSRTNSSGRYRAGLVERELECMRNCWKSLSQVPKESRLRALLWLKDLCEKGEDVT